jgi:hypothetical protein
MMKFKIIFLLFLSLGLVQVSFCEAVEEDTDDDTTVEVEDEPVVVEKVIILKFTINFCLKKREKIFHIMSFIIWYF